MPGIGVYVHIPYCRGKCRYCSFVSTVNLSSQRQYVEALKREIAAFRRGETAETVYIGGGTPSCLYAGAIEEIMDCIGDRFTVEKTAEVTIEANPESTSTQFFDECRRAGINRVSIGLQCANDDVLKKAGRLHSVRQFIDAVKAARAAGIDNISADFIVGLEGETHDDVKNTLDLITSLNIPHISVYSLSVEKGSIMYACAYRPDEDDMADEYVFASDCLRSRGYERYEISNFAKNGQIGRHNRGYWLHKPYIGFGAAAHSYIDGERFSNTENIASYIGGLTTVYREKIDAGQLREEYIMLRLRLKEGIDLNEYKSLFGSELTDVKGGEIQKLKTLGVIDVADNRLFATDKGVYVLNSIITELI